MTAPMESRRVNEIDLLRFAAALAVVFFHYAFRGYAADDRSIMPYPLLAPVAKYGYLGVELFFLISGFVILMTASRGSLKAFAVSRFVRLYPAFWACCTLTFLAIAVLGAERYSATLPQYLVNMTMLSGFVGVPSIDGVYWSLFVELQFYALVAVLVAIGRIHQAQFFLSLWLLASIALEMFPIGSLRFLLLTGYSAYFIGGAMSFLIWSRGVTIYRVCVMAACLALALQQSLAGIPGFEQHFHTDMNRFAVGAIVSAFFVVMLLVALRRTGAVGRQRWLVAGALTYPLYLIHQNIGFMIFNVAYPAINAHLLFWGTLLLMLVIAYAVHVLIERRFSPRLKQFAGTAWDGVAGRLSRLRAYVPGKQLPGKPAGSIASDQRVD
ncbi:acyltransferase family protein [Lysobacter koreensis]|uniref:Acyltransferase family protein n=1 Tax=Lysobacter koreensis TaxID=266122 RepID=A0ABW2YHK9_9GAMM